MNFKQNMGKLDRYLRVIAALVIGYMYLNGSLPEAFGLAFVIIAVIFVATSFVGFCPLYLPFKMNTKDPDHRELP
jgi:hypothetical protein